MDETCSECSFVNRPGWRFCGECGAKSLAEEPFGEPVAVVESFRALAQEMYASGDEGWQRADLEARLPELKVSRATFQAVLAEVTQASSGCLELEVDSATIEGFRVGRLCEVRLRSKNTGARGLRRVAIQFATTTGGLAGEDQSPPVGPGRHALLTATVTPREAGQHQLRGVLTAEDYAHKETHYAFRQSFFVGEPQEGPHTVVHNTRAEFGDVRAADLSGLRIGGDREKKEESGRLILDGSWVPVALRLLSAEACAEFRRANRLESSDARRSARTPREAARTTPRALSLLAGVAGQRPLKRAVLTIGAGGDLERYYLFAGDGLRLGRQMPTPGDAQANDVVLRIPAAPELAGTEHDPNLQLSRRHVELVRCGANVAVVPLGSCATSVSGRPVSRGAEAQVGETFQLVLGPGAVSLDGQVLGALDPVARVAITPRSKGAQLPPTSVVGGAEASHPLLSVRLRRQTAPLGQEYHLVLRQVALGSSADCAITLPGAGVAPVHARVLNVRGCLVLQPVAERGLTTTVGDSVFESPDEALFLTDRLVLQLGALQVRVQAIEDAMFRA